MSLRDKIEAGRSAIRAGVTVAVSPTLYPTPPAIAARLADVAELFPLCSVLEPSAGTGAIMEAIRSRQPGAIIAGIEIDPRLADMTGSTCGDFLTLDPERFGLFDRVVMNPPFNGGADVLHVRHALRFLRPGGILVAIIADGPRQDRAALEMGAEDVDRLPPGTFSGTSVRSRIIRIGS